MQNQLINKKRKMDRWTILHIRRFIESLAIIFLIMYPLRHIHYGIDLWDTGYNFANYEYMGLDHMDSMWLFATYLTNSFGHLLTMLPYGKTLLGMNLYTGLTVSVLAVCSYLFCTRQLHMSKWLSFVGEFIAISLSWCPTGVLYNYITYVLLNFAVIFLYDGLTKKKNRYLIFAGICLGTNLFVRFPNIAQVVLILAVWGYGVVEACFESWGEAKTVRRKAVQAALKRTGFRTLWCLIGYLGVVIVMITYFAVRYGTFTYFQNISRLFMMTENATDYSGSSMLMGIILYFVGNLYWETRALCFAIAGVIVCLAAKLMDWKIKGITQKGKGVWPFENGFTFLGVAYLISIFLSYVAIIWLVMREFTSTYYQSYDSMLRPAIFFLTILLLMAVVTLFHPAFTMEEKLLSMLLGISILVSSIGSNNGLYPSINCLYIGAPYVLWNTLRFVKIAELRSAPEEGKNWKVTLQRRVKWLFSLFPFKSLLICMLLLCMVQFGLFGWYFVFGEATGIQNFDGYVANNMVLRGIYMQENREPYLYDLTRYVSEHQLTGTEMLQFCEKPALHFYLQMPAAFNPWPELRSYQFSFFEEQLAIIQQKIDAQTAYHKIKPCVILSHEDGVAYNKMRNSVKEEYLLLQKKHVQESGAEGVIEVDVAAANRQKAIENVILAYEQEKLAMDPEIFNSDNQKQRWQKWIALLQFLLTNEYELDYSTQFVGVLR